MNFRADAISYVDQSEGPCQLINFYKDNLSTSGNMRDTVNVCAVPTSKVCIPASTSQNESGVVLVDYSVWDYGGDLMKDHPMLLAFSTDWGDGGVDAISVDEKTSLIQAAQYNRYRIGPNKDDNDNDDDKRQINNSTRVSTKTFPSAEIPPSVVVNNNDGKKITPARDVGMVESGGKEYPANYTMQEKPFMQTESLKSLKREIAASRERLNQVWSLLQDDAPANTADKAMKTNTFTSPLRRESVSPISYVGAAASPSTSQQKSPSANRNELYDMNNYFSAGSRVLDAMRKEMQQGTLLSAPRATGRKLREAWRRNPILPEHLHHVADIEGVGLVRLSRLITVLRAHGFLDWTEMEVARICAFLASQPNDEDDHIERGIVDLDKSMTHIVIKEEDGMFYLNGGAFFALLRALLMM
ncbi:uncharacterized protein TM35_000212350 [Trypanosoma theileri]|uniref:Uncharacterized protein n=1 Tax=Trypanosoma theileri TaxID=67003 RepID=A0A1X0NTX3_9TRYP|nr:uncharacterized protein TM35_000212350 [Trypanosoma theileri]ORC87629.1 hypothetical protein TM35_000212350 [Trypanosoma theileri]